MANNKKKALILGVIIILVLVAIMIPKLVFNKNNHQVIPSQQLTKKKISVDVLVINPGMVENTIESNGTVIAGEEVEIKSEVTGKLMKIGFKEGSHVKKGDLLFKLNDSELKAQLFKAESKMKLQESKLQRQSALLNKQGISQEEYDNSVNDLNSVKADIEDLQAKIEKTNIIAPFDGVAGLRRVSPGAIINPEMKLTIIQSRNPIKIDFSIPQKYSSFVKNGKEVIVSQSTNGNSFKAKIYASEPKIDESTRTVLVRALCNNDRGELVPGSFVDVKLILEDIRNAIMVPTDLVVPDVKGETVFIYKNGIAHQKVIKTGIRTDSLVQITEGLKYGDSVISSGIIQLREGTKVSLAK
jgi:membrane fusion protein, multidrug efflux system